MAGLLISGAASVWRMWNVYRTDEFADIFRWSLAHMSLGVLALLMALLLTVGRRPPENPVRWMRLNLVVLLVVIFLGSSTRHFQFVLRDRQDRPDGKKPPTTLVEDRGPATQKAAVP